MASGNLEVAVRLHSINDDMNGHYYSDDMEHEFDIRELGNEVPKVGDFIVDPGVIAGQDRSDHANRRVFGAVARYFFPHAHREKLGYVALVVKSRPVAMPERHIVCVS